jgi:hypothetical protein
MAVGCDSGRSKGKLVEHSQQVFQLQIPSLVSLTNLADGRDRVAIVKSFVTSAGDPYASSDIAPEESKPNCEPTRSECEWR